MSRSSITSEHKRFTLSSILIFLFLAACGSPLSSSNSIQVISPQNATQIKLLNTLRADKIGNIDTLSFGNSSNTLLTGSQLPDNSIRLWDIRTGTQRVLVNGKGQGITKLAVSPDGSKLAFANALGETVIWDIAQQKELFELKNSGCLFNEMIDVDFNPQGTLLATSCAQIDNNHNVGLVQLWDIQTGTLRHDWQGTEARVWTVAFNPDGTLLASGSGGDLLAQQAGVVRIYDVKTANEVATFQGQTLNIKQVVFSPDGTYLASASSDGTIILWDVQGKKSLLTVKHPEGGVNGISFHPSGEILASVGDDGTIRLWDMKNGSELTVLQEEFGGMVYTVSFDPSGTVLAAAGSSGGLVTIWGIK
ncbi:MAG: WD40 repeat domain-containing protein [Anaerolineae bacterium]|nr:WD40 repeat domain-containing protein [Anaerolineae bacterium]